MVVATPALLQKVGDLVLQVDGVSTCPSPEVHNLGIILDSTLSFQSHIKSITKMAFFHLRNISRLRPYLFDSVTETLIHAFISSRLDYCNGVLYGLPDKALNVTSMSITQLPGFSPAPSLGSPSPPSSLEMSTKAGP